MQKYYKNAINLGDFFQSPNNLASYYKDLTRELKKAELSYNIGIKNGNLKSINQMAIYQYETKKNTKEILKYLNKALNSGSVYAIYSLGHYYFFREKKNYEKMLDCYEDAINFDIPNAMNDLAYYYDSIEKNYEKAIYFYKKATDEHKFLYSYNNLGVLYKNNIKNHKLMYKYLSEGINKGCRYSMYSLALYYHKIDKNEDLMKKYYEASYNAGYRQAGYMLGLYYQYDKMNYEKMYHYYQRNIRNHKCIKSMIKLGVYYFDVEHNIDRAKYYMNLATQNGGNIGYYYLGLINKMQGNHKEMVKNYKLAAEKGITHSMLKLALHYKELKNYKDMNKYLLMAIKKGHHEALDELISHVEQQANSDINLLNKNYNETQNKILQNKLPKLKELKGKFHDYNYRMFIINYYILNNPLDAIKFLKKYVSMNSKLALTDFEEYKDYQQQSFKQGCYNILTKGNKNTKDDYKNKYISLSFHNNKKRKFSSDVGEENREEKKIKLSLGKG